MIHIIFLLITFFLFAGNTYAACVASGSDWASTPDYASVSQCVTNADAGDTITVSAGSATWTSQLNISKRISLIGAGKTSTVITAGTDLMQLINISLTIDSGTILRISGFGFNMANLAYYGIYGSNSTNTKVHNVRIDNNKFYNNAHPTVSSRCIQTKGPLWGVIDNNEFVGGGDKIADFYGHNTSSDWSTFQNDRAFGTVDNIYFEDNIVSNTMTVTSDGQGGRYCLRFNTYNTSAFVLSGMFPLWDQHGNQYSSYATMMFEVYKNTVTAGTKGGYLCDHRGGKGMVWGNSVTSTTTVNSVKIRDEFDDAQANAPTGNPGTYTMRVIDSYYWLNRNNTTTRIDGWIAQDSDDSCGTYCNPAYGCSSGYCLEQNVNFWQEGSTFDGTQGVGVGLLSARPATCTTGVGYWATDQGSWNTSGSGGQGVLYKCTSTNTWSLYYTPYTYPHPLRSGEIMEDTTPPVILSKSPTGSTACDAASPVDKTLTVQTNENADCAYCEDSGTCTSSSSYIAVLSDGSAFSSTNGTVHTQTLADLPCSASYHYRVSCRDKSPNQNAMTAPESAQFDIGAAAGGDVTPPVMSNPLPAGTVYNCGSDVTLQVTATDDTAVTGCKYNATDTDYASMTGTFDAPGGVPSQQLDDSYYEVGSTASAYLYSGGKEENGKSFTSQGGTLDSVKFLLSKEGSPTGNAVAKVYAHTGTYGTSSLPTGVALATSDNFDVSTLTTGTTLKTFTFSGANRITLVNETKYVVVLAYSGGDISNKVRMWREDVILGHGGNDVYYYVATGWDYVLSVETIFYLYTMTGTSGDYTYTLTAPACGQIYTYKYRCTDGTNPNTVSETATFTIASAAQSGVVEAESGANVSPMLEIDDAAASGGQYVHTTTEFQGTSTHSVVVSEAATYRIIIRTHAADSGSDSMFLQVNSEPQVTISFNPTAEAGNFNIWREQIAFYYNGSAWQQYQVALTADTHTFVWTGREALARLDYFYLQKVPTPTVPPLPTQFKIIGSGSTLGIDLPGSANTISIP